MNVLLYVFGALLFAVQSFANWQDSPYADLSETEIQERRDQLEHRPLNRSIDRNRSNQQGCTRYKLQIPTFDPTKGEYENVGAIFTVPKSKEKVPAFVIIPTLAGTTRLETNYAKNLCRRGFASVYPDNSVDYSALPKVYPGWEVFDENIERSIARAKTMLDFLESDPAVDPDKLGAIGGSLGAIYVSMLSGVDDRIKATIMFAPGANLPNIVRRSQAGDVKKLRKGQLPHVPGGIDKYEEVLLQHVTYDPIIFRKYIDPKKVHMGLIRNDNMVPTDRQVDLWQALGEPASLKWRSGSHVWALLQYSSLNGANEFLKTAFD